MLTPRMVAIMRAATALLPAALNHDSCVGDGVARRDSDVHECRHQLHEFYRCFQRESTRRRCNPVSSRNYGHGESRQHSRYRGSGERFVRLEFKPAAGDGVYYTSSSSGLGPDFSKVFSFVVPAGTPADTYLLRMGVGRGSLGGEFTDVSLTVGEVPEPATLAMLLGGAPWDWSAGGVESISRPSERRKARTTVAGWGTVSIFAVVRERDVLFSILPLHELCPRQANSATGGISQTTIR